MIPLKSRLTNLMSGFKNSVKAIKKAAAGCQGYIGILIDVRMTYDANSEPLQKPARTNSVRAGDVSFLYCT